MQPELNPYSPGSGLRPPEMTGREAEVDAFDLIVARTKLGHPNRSMMLTGLRGVGKTVLLNALRAQAERAEWFAISLEATPESSGAQSIRDRLARELVTAARRLRPQKRSTHWKEALGSVGSFTAKLGLPGASFGLEMAPGRADSGRIEIDLAELVEDLAPALHEDSSAFVVFIDELQELDEELLSALVTVQHQSGQREWPFYLVGAGLPNLPARLSEARTYAERLFNYRQIGPLEPRAAEQAFAAPAQRSGGEYSPEALQIVTQASKGYPYFIQTFGKNIWDVAPEKRFTAEDARLAVELGWRELDAGFFPARWDRATAAERSYLTAMAAEAEHETTTHAVAERLGRKQTALSTVRAGLVSKGLVFRPEHGRIAFTVPGMAEFINRQQPGE